MPPRMGGWSRAGFAALAAGMVVVLGLAAWLRPDPRGYGTHMQIGLPACSFLEMTRLPCPSCGMTTAFSWSVRGRLDRAAISNPAGMILALSLGLMAPWLFKVAATGSPRPFRTADQPVVAVALGVVAISLVVWIVRMSGFFPGFSIK